MVTALLATIVFPGLGPETISFDSFRTGMMPPYWTAASAHGVPPRWEIRRDPHAPTRQNVLVPVSSPGGVEYPLAVYDRFVCRDGEVSVKFKITGGQQARRVGIVFRYRDPSDYYLLALSADQGKISLVRVQDGQPHPIPAVLRTKNGARGEQTASPGPAGISHPINVNEWYVARVAYQGNLFHVSLGNRLLFDAKDDGPAAQGKTGLWTKGDTAAEFDDFRPGRKG